MKIIYTILCVLGASVLFTQPVSAQDAWPKTMTASNGTVIKLYQWQPESFADNTLKARAAVSVLESGKTDPVFGMAWLRATTQTAGDQVLVQSTRISSIKLPGELNDDKLEDLKQLLEEQVGNSHISFPLKDLQSSLDLNKQQTALSQQISNTPPKVLYSNTPSILVLIDGAPKLQRSKEWGVEAVVNTPFTIVKNNDGHYYLFGGKHWYKAPAAIGPFALTTNVSQNLLQVEQAVRTANKDDEEGMETDENTIYKIVVSTGPAELIQSKGEANLASVEGTSLLYVSNSDDDIFMDINSQQYYVLISGRWFNSKTLSGNWRYVSASELPADFAQIQEGSPKDNVLASVAGTDAAKDALRDAEVPQTAKVDRKKAQANITYDGDPEFENIDGTDLEYATNTGGSVIRWRGRYYSVDNGVWFESPYAVGPWTVAIVRPSMVALIPPRYPVYNVKYVYIYDVSPDYVYMGYTPGYLNTFVYGPTVVYGTGYYYRPWYRHYYYPRPCTWGYGVRYNPWFGWGMGFNYNAGWFHINIGIGGGHPWGYWSGGWWGPRSYRMPYCYSPYRGGNHYGYYNNRYFENRNRSIMYASRNNNIYNHRSYVMNTRDNRRSISPANSNYNRRYAGYNNNNRFDNGNNRINNNNNNSNRGYNNRNGETRNNNTSPIRRYDRNSRTDYPTNRNREIIQRPNRTYTPPSSNREPVRREYDNPSRRPGNPTTRPVNPTPGGNREITPRTREWRGDNTPRNSGGSSNPGRVMPQQNREPVNRGGGGGVERQRPSSSQPQHREGGSGNNGGRQSGGGGGRESRSGGSGNVSRPGRG